MEVVNLVFAILGHVLASVLYVARRIKFSSSSDPSAPPALPASRVAIDTSSILERKDELKELWEKKMMANEHPVGNEESKKDDEELKSVQPIELPNGDSCKMSNGDIHCTQIDIETKCKDGYEDANGVISAPETPNAKKTDENKLFTTGEDGDSKEMKENDSLVIQNETKAERVEEEECVLIQNGGVEIECHEIEVKEQIFTSTQTLVVTKKVETTVVEEQKEIQVIENKLSLEDTEEEFEETEKRIEAEESLQTECQEEQLLVVLQQDESVAPEEDLVSAAVDEREHEAEENSLDIPDQLDSPDSLEAIEIQGKGDDFEHYTVLESRSSENELTINNEVKQEAYYESVESSYSSTTQETLTILANEQITSETVFSQNGEMEEKTFDDHFVLDTREVISPIADDDKKDVNKKSRIHTLGVQKTEQPYSTCTTETKIAMEIREMREREEELKKMRERQAQISPVPPQPQKSTTPPPTKVLPPQRPPQSPGYMSPNAQKISTTPGYRVSSVFGTRGISQVKEENKFTRNKESPVEKEIRLAKEREEELRNQKGLPPREDDSYVKPSQVKSSQAKAFGKMVNAENSRLIATAKIQHEIEEQTLREMALRESGHIQTLSSERTDAKVTKLKALEIPSPECTSPTFQNGNGSLYTNGNSSNGHVSPDYLPSKRSSPSPTGSNYSSQYTVPRNVLPPGGNKGISMQKFIASRGKETTFAAPRNGPFSPKMDYQDTTSRTIPEPGKLKRTVSVESKIQQEILEMKLREEELKHLHTRAISPTTNGNTYDVMTKNNGEYHLNGDSGEAEDPCPRRSNLIAQWEQRIQKSEGRA